MPKDILNIVFAPKKMSEITSVNDMMSWEQCRKKQILFHSKPFLLGNPSFIVTPKEFPVKKAPEENKVLRNLIYLWWGSITKCEIECIVNSANIKLKYGGGVCGAIFRGAGTQLLEEEISNKYPNGCEVTQCALTESHKLPTKYIIHAVGPAQMDYAKLSLTYKNVLNLCIENNIRQLCFCCIGCGTHSLPIKDAAKIAVYSVIKFLMQPIKDDKQQDDEQEEEEEEEKKQDDKNEKAKFGYQYFDKIVFNCFTEDEIEAYKVWLQEKLG